MDLSGMCGSLQEVNARKKSIVEATSQAQVLLKEGRDFETASLPRGFEKELARLEVSHPMPPEDFTLPSSTKSS